MPIVKDIDLYNYVKELANKVYEKPSAYKSGWIVKKYKELGGEYSDDNKSKNLKRWFKENWTDIGNKEYPVYRPTKRISKDTPLTIHEIEPNQLKEQIELKQKIKGEKNLPPFKSNILLVEANKIPKNDIIWNYSNPKIVSKKAKEYLGKDIKVYRSTRKDKKYMVLNPEGKKIHFGQIGFSDFTQHQDEKRRDNYLTRTANIKGNWRENKYSANNLSREILW